MNTTLLGNLTHNIRGYLKGRRDVGSDSVDFQNFELESTLFATQVAHESCMLDMASNMYLHVKRYGIDRTFLSLHNSHGELDRVCGIRFPACEDMNAVGDRYSRYSVAFIAAMEDAGEGIFAKIANLIKRIFTWIIEKISAFIKWITGNSGKPAQLEKQIEKIEASEELQQQAEEKLKAAEEAKPGILKTVLAAGGVLIDKIKAAHAEAKEEARLKKEEKVAKNEVRKEINNIESDVRAHQGHKEQLAELKRQRAAGQYGEENDRMTATDKHALEQLKKEMAKYDETIAQLNVQLQGLYTGKLTDKNLLSIARIAWVTVPILNLSHSLDEILLIYTQRLAKL